MKVKVKPSYKYKMSTEELQNYLNMKRSGASKTKNARIYNRKSSKKSFDF